MSNVYIETIPIPRISRNKRIYAGNVSTTKVTNNMLDPLHIEWATLTELITNVISVTFKLPFQIVPTGWIKVYRMREIVTSRFKQQDVLYYHATVDFKTKEGFNLVIDPKESLTGVIIEYFFI